MTAHSLFPASAAKRLIACPGSFRLTAEAVARGETLPGSSVYAAEGTTAHRIAEETLKLDDGRAELFVGAKNTVDGHSFTVDEAMAEHVQVYVDYVQGLVSLGYHVRLEQRVEPIQPWAGQQPPLPLFGTSDCIAWDPQRALLEIVDLKYGAGVPVEVKDNEQLKYYALGALRFVAGHFITPFGIKRVRTTIIQPRAPHPDGPIRSHDYTPGELLAWGVDVLRPAVERAVLTQDAPLAAGAHCRFCPVLAACPENRKTAQDKAREVFDDGTDRPLELFAPDQLSKDLVLADQLEDWIAAVRAEAHRRLELGSPVPGFKLVAKRAVRRWTDEEAVRALAEANGVDLTETTLVSPAQADMRLKGRTSVLAALKRFTAAKSSGTTLAPEEDPRPAVQGRETASEAFAGHDFDLFDLL